MRPPRHRLRPPSAGPHRARAGLSLLESAAVLSVSGIVLAGFVPTFLSHVRLSKIAEATEQLDALHRAAASYYALPQQVGGRTRLACLPDPAAPMPAQPSLEPALVDFTADDSPARATWKALGITEPLSIRYSYSVDVPQPGCGPRESPRGAPVITFRAEGDLDADGIKSLIERSATLSADQRELVPIPPLRIERRVE